MNADLQIRYRVADHLRRTMNNWQVVNSCLVISNLMQAPGPAMIATLQRNPLNGDVNYDLVFLLVTADSRLGTDSFPWTLMGTRWVKLFTLTPTGLEAMAVEARPENELIVNRPTDNAYVPAVGRGGETTVTLTGNPLGRHRARRLLKAAESLPRSRPMRTGFMESISAAPQDLPDVVTSILGNNYNRAQLMT